MEDNQINQQSPEQLNPGQVDSSGKEVAIKKSEGISEQGNEWADSEELSSKGGSLFDKKAEKYIKDPADMEGLPDEEDEREKNRILNKAATTDTTNDDDGENVDEVIEDKEDYVPGFDLGRNKVQ